MLLSACAGLPVPETPAQRLYVLQNQYAILADAAAAYLELADADPQLVRRIQTLDRLVYHSLKQARLVLQTPSESSTMETRLQALDRLMQELRTELSRTEQPIP